MQVAGPNEKAPLKLSSGAGAWYNAALMMPHCRGSGSRPDPTHQRLLQRGLLSLIALIKLDVTRLSPGLS
jgi:hypothetical protein